MRRPPRGGRGLKCEWAGALCRPCQSPPSRGAWIEICMKSVTENVMLSPPSRGAWIEISQTETRAQAAPSPPSRGAWIEMIMIAVCSWKRCCRPPSRGAWIEIDSGAQTWLYHLRRPPRGGRGWLFWGRHGV